MSTITVTTTADTSDGTVTLGSPTISLRDAIVYSENNAGTTIDIPSGTYTLNSDLPLVSQSTTFIGSTITLPVSGNL